MLLASAALLALVLRSAPRLGASLWPAVAILGGWLTALAGLTHVYRGLEPRGRSLDFLSHLVALKYRALGIPATADPPFVHWQGTGSLHTFDCSLEKAVGPALALFFAVGVGTLIALRGRALGWRKPLALLALTFAFAMTRLLALGLALDQTGEPAIFYARLWVYGGLLVLASALAVVLPLVPGLRAATRVSLRSPDATRRRSFGPMVATAAALGLLFAGAAGFYDPGTLKHGQRGGAARGRVLVDENHSNWEWSTIAFDTLRYGTQTVYNYAELVRYLQCYYEVSSSFAPLTDSLLATTDVVVLKTPTRPYADREVEALLRFVEAGGGLWLVGDHTNIFGMGMHLNKVARHFGLRFHYDAVIDLLTHGRQLFQRPRLFAHPSVRHLPPLLFATSCSLEGASGAETVMLGRSLLSDAQDYAVNTFFGNFKPDPDEGFGCMLQSQAVAHGRGRVLVFTDSTIFSNFFMCIRGKPELALGSVSWLMHENRWAWARPAFGVAAWVAALGFLLLAWRRPRRVALAALALACLPAFALAARGLDAWVGRWSHFPEPRQALPLVAFDRGRTEFAIPDLAEIPDRSPSSYHTFYVWTQRVGWFPTTRLFEDCTDGTAAVVLVNPRAPFSAAEVETLAGYVRGGGALVVLDTPHAKASTANSLLQPFGIQFQAGELDSTWVFDARGDSLLVMHHMGAVRGGGPLLRTADGRAIASEARFGAGRVVALHASDSFTDAVLGTTSEVPTPAQLALYRIEYRIFGDILRARATRDSATAPSR